MERSPILFRCDGNSHVGWESLYQSLTFASALQRRRRLAYFLGQIDPFPLIAQVARGGNEYLAAEHRLGSPEDCEATIREIRRLSVAAVVVAGSGVSEEYLRNLATTGVMIAVMDYEAKVTFPGKLVFNTLLGPERKSYKFDRGTQLCIGRRYAIVRTVFRRQRPIRALDPVAPFRGIIAFGDDDFAEQSLVRAQELLGNTRIDKITVAVRSQNPQLAELRELAENHKGRMEVLTEPSELNTRLPRAHFALTSGDSWSLEMACVGVPQFIISQTQRHKPNAKLLDDHGAGTYLGTADEVTNATLRDAVQNLLSDPIERIGMSRCGRNLIDGRGPDRMVNALEIMLHPAMTTNAEERIAA